VIDSGSTDSTLLILKKFLKKHANLRLHEILNHEFGHGKTRNLAAQMAKGEIVVYLSHDAIPSHDRWLYEMVQPFEVSPSVAGVMGKQLPRPSCFPLLKYEIEHVFQNFGPDFGTTLFYKDTFIQDQSVYDATAFYSDVNSAARRSILLNSIPYRDVPYSEDQMFGRDILEHGLIKAYAPRGSVIHSNDLRLSEYRRRMFDETLALREVGISNNNLTPAAVCKLFIRGVIGDTLRIMKDGNYGWKRKLYWIIINPLYHYEKWKGVYTALKVDINDTDTIEKKSLERRRRS
jgi:rhamnosyltransferase